jgi:hypothetical protein
MATKPDEPAAQAVVPVVGFVMTLDNSLYLGDEWVKAHPDGGTVKIHGRDADTTGGWVTAHVGEIVDTGVFPASTLHQLVGFGRAQLANTIAGTA